MKNFRVPLCFGGFAALIAMRDIAIDLWLKENSLTLALAICATILLLSIVNLAMFGSIQSLVRKLVASPQLLIATIGFGVFSGVMYAVVFFFVQTMGAGLFNIIDYGLAPLLTAALGVWWLDRKQEDQGERSGQLAASIGLYILGVILLMVPRGMTGVQLIWLALLVPLATSCTDALTRWLQTQNTETSKPTEVAATEAKVTLEPQELLIMRFAPATLVLFACNIFANTGFTLARPLPVFATGALFGFVPLWLLAIGLRKGELRELAVWEFLIPAISFFGTLYAHPENAGGLPVSGAILVLVAFVVGQMKPPKRRLQAQEAGEVLPAPVTGQIV